MLRSQYYFFMATVGTDVPTPSVESVCTIKKNLPTQYGNISTGDGIVRVCSQGDKYDGFPSRRRGFKSFIIFQATFSALNDCSRRSSNIVRLFVHM